ncbi:MAG: LEA type 2 family protein [bacterium]
MKKISAVLLVVLFISGCSVFNQMNAIKNLDYEYDSFEVGMPTLSGMKFIVNMKVSNPNKADVTLNKVSYQIFVDEMKVAEGMSENVFVIRKKESSIYPTTLVIGYNDASDFLTKFTVDMNAKIEVRGDAEFKTSFGTYKFPFKVEKKFSEISE